MMSLRSRLAALGVCSVVVLVGCSLLWAAIEKGDLVGSPARSAEFEVFGFVIIQLLGWMWMVTSANSRVLTVVMGITFQLATSARYVGWSATNLARLTAQDDRFSDETKTSARWQLAGSCLCWVSTIAATAVVCGESLRSSAGARLCGPLVLAVTGAVILFATHETSRSNGTLDAAAATVVMFWFAVLGATSQDQDAITDGVALLCGLSGWFLLQSHFDIDSEANSSDETLAGFVLCWLGACLLVVVIVTSNTESSTRTAPGVGHEMNGHDQESLNGALASLGITEGTTFVAEKSSDGSIVLIQCVRHGPPLRTTLTGLTEQLRTTLLQNRPSRKLRATINDIVVLHGLSINMWKASRVQRSLTVDYGNGSTSPTSRTMTQSSVRLITSI